MKIKIIGGGLAGCEAAWQIAKFGGSVELYEMKPRKKTPAHKTDMLAELVCSNSFKAARVNSSAGLLKEEMRRLGSLLMECADKSTVAAGGALAVDRDIFSGMVTHKIKNCDKITVVEEEISEIPEGDVVIIATGPLTSENLAENIKERFGGSLSFFDAAAPIVTADSIDMNSAFTASRYGKGDGDDYINCPMNKEEYEIFWNELVHAERTPLHGVDIQNPKVYEGCMPIEVMAQRGEDTIRFGPMKPVGLIDPRTNHRPWAVLQLRKENAYGSMYNLVGFQTNLKFGEQKRVFGLIPALKNAEFVRYGVMHRNTFIDSPRILNADFSCRSNPNLFFAGQLTGVEGYMESGASGLIAGRNAASLLGLCGKLVPPKYTMIGALCNYISDESVKNFQPMGANFGVMPPLEEHIRDKQLRATAYAQRALNFYEEMSNNEDNS